MAKGSRTYSDRQKYQINYQKKWREDHRLDLRKYDKARSKERKKLLIATAGGVCVKCGYNKCFRALGFHHINPNEKEYKRLTNLPLAIALKEIKKCILVCANCHMEIHDDLENS